MKQFIIISMLTVMALPSLACSGMGTKNYYLFSVCSQQEFSQRVNDITNKNWQAYLGNTKEYYWFDADEVIKAAQAKNDQLMVSYVRNLKQYLDCADEVASERWDYPSKDQLAKRRQTLLSVQRYAFSKIRTRLRSQHALLYMRCNMLLGNHAANVTFWEQTASHFIETVYKDMMHNIYAGALLKTGRAEEAGRLFAEMGDWNSLMTQYYKNRSFAAIRQEYLRDANSAVLPFLLQDFVNNAQEAVDAEQSEGMEGKLFIRKIVRSEAEQMIQFAGQVVGEGKTEVPALWKTAQAWLQYLWGHRQQAVATIKTATALDGTERMKDNARVIRLYIDAEQQKIDKQYDTWLAGELKWLSSRSVACNEDGYGYYHNALERVVHQVLGPKYLQAGHPLTALAIYRYVGSGHYLATIDTMRVDMLQQYISYCQTEAATPLEQTLKPRQHMDQDAMNDLVGTKYMRLCQWDKAVPWLSRVPLTYYNNKGYACYAYHRKYTVEPWIQRQWLKAGLEWSDTKWQLKQHPKIAFCREMQQMEGEVNVMSGQQQQQRYYDLAVRYAQASFTGDCWYLMHDGKSCYDTVSVNEVDLNARALSYLRKASRSSDFKLKERSLFAMTYYYLHEKPWYILEWDDKKMEDVRKLNTESSQYQSLTELARFEQQNSQRTSPYVSRCDNYKSFLNSRKR